MDQIEQLQAATSSLLDKAQNGSVADLASAVDKATGALGLSAELEKSRAETEKLQYENATAAKRQRSETWKEYATILTPIVTIITLAATLLVQSCQFSQSEKDKREAAEDALWGETVKSISQASKLSPIVTELQPFLNSPRYAVRARTSAVELLSNGTNTVFFRDLFGAAFVPLDWNNLDYVLKLDGSLRVRVEKLFEKTYDPATQKNNTKKLTKQEHVLFDYGTSALDGISTAVGTLLKAPRPPGRTLDLSGGYFSQADWRGVDLNGARISGAIIVGVNLKNADLSKITEFEGVSFDLTAWWEANAMGPELLTYLQENYRCDPHIVYGPQQQKKFTSQECIAAIERLKHPAADSPSPIQ